MVHQLKVPLALSCLQIDAHQRFPEEIVAWPVASIEIPGGGLNGQIDQPQLFIHGKLRPHSGVASVFCGTVEPCLVAKFPLLGNRVEDPQALTRPNVKATDVSFVVAHALGSEALAKGSADDHSVLGDE